MSKCTNGFMRKMTKERKGPWLLSGSIFLDRGIGVGLVAKDNIQGNCEQVRDSLYGCELGKGTEARST